MRQVYPACLLKDLLKSYKSINSNNGMPCLEKFNPKTQRLVVVTQNVMASKLYKDFTFGESRVSAIKKLLDDFHNAIETSQKIIIAQEILKKLPEQDSLFTKESLILVSSFKYFLKIYSSGC